MDGIVVQGKEFCAELVTNAAMLFLKIASMLACVAGGIVGTQSKEQLKESGEEAFEEVFLAAPTTPPATQATSIPDDTSQINVIK